jgi:stage II sporulation protein D
MLVCFAAVALAAGSGQDVRIGIREGRGTVSVIGTQNVGIYKDGTLWKKVPANTPVQVSLQGDALAVNNSVSKGAIAIRPLDKNGAVKITDGYTYRGAIECIKSPGRWGLTVVNVVPLEQYLYGVVGKEMSPSWSAEALKAQAVAARTYAVSHKNYFKKKGFDMADDTRNQVYAGVNGESPSIRQAVDATSGEIMTCQGKPIEAYFCASAGGWTEHSENVWGSRLSYLRGVSDDSNEMPSYRWSVTTTPEKMAANLSAASKGVGKIQSITLSPLTRRPISAADRGISGRVLTMTIKGTGGQVNVTGNAFQSIYGLKSTLFDFYEGSGTAPDPDAGKKARNTVLTVKAGQPLTIYGVGWGHGLGMSQFGAYQMAKKHSSDASYYRTILTHYYTGTRIEKLY